MMNALLFEKIQSLSSDRKEEIKRLYARSPLMLRFISFIEKQPKEHFSTAEAVCYVYEIKKSDNNYVVYENRFYKLRKKLNETLRNNKAVFGQKLPMEQQQMNEAKMLVDSGKFKEAQILLEKTAKQCWQNNVFEILPEVIDRLIQVNQALNTIDKNKPLHKTYQQAIALYTDLMEAKNIIRQIYEVNLIKGFAATSSLYNRLSKLVVKHRNFLRFKLMYNIVSAYYKIGAGGRDYIASINVINRHISTAKQIMHSYPDIPAVYYMQGFQANQYYRLNEMQALSNYNALRYKEAADVMFPLYEKVMEKRSKFTLMKNEVFFTNTIHILVNAARYDDAQIVLEEYKTFITENRLHERLYSVYYEAANIHSAMFPAKSKYNPDFLLKQLEKHNKAIKTNQHLDFGYALKIRLLMAEQRFEDVLYELKKMDLKPFFAIKEIVKLTQKVAEVKTSSISEGQITGLKNEIKKMSLSAKIPDDYSWLLFLDRILKYSK